MSVEMFTGSVSENRMTIGFPPDIRLALYEAARQTGQRPQEYLRHVLRNCYDLGMFDPKSRPR